MREMPKMFRSPFAGLLAVILLTACGGGGGGGQTGSPLPDPPQQGTPPPSMDTDETFTDELSTAHFLTQATFGPTKEDIETLTGTDVSDWLQAEFAKPPTYYTPYVLQAIDTYGYGQDGGLSFFATISPINAFWPRAIESDDQLRQRMVYALSQILVVSHRQDALGFFPTGMAGYQDILVEHAFGNYRDLLEDVTYSWAMAEYLTYMQNMKGDPATGRMPDENYARELMQLFTIGLVELNNDGTPRLDGNGNAIETYTNEDITGLAKVFTGLSYDLGAFWSFPDTQASMTFATPLVFYDRFHSDLEKSFLGTTIPAGTSGPESVDMALDTLFNHPNLGPFLGRQLIQRFVTSDPSPAYIQRVASAFDTGLYVLPDGSSVGEGQRGDLSATIAAVLMDDEARDPARRDASDFGKLREPVIRFTQWARAFDASHVYSDCCMWEVSNSLGQSPWRSPSVFNFYRPGYVAPGTESGATGMTVPELQIVDAGTIAGYPNFMTYYVFGFSRYDDPDNPAMFPDYTEEIALAYDEGALVDHLNSLLVYGSLEESTQTDIAASIALMPASLDGSTEEQNNRFDRVAMAVLLVMTSPEFVVQK